MSFLFGVCNHYKNTIWFQTKSLQEYNIVVDWLYLKILKPANILCRVFGNINIETTVFHKRKLIKFAAPWKERKAKRINETTDWLVKLTLFAMHKNNGSEFMVGVLISAVWQIRAHTQLVNVVSRACGCMHWYSTLALCSVHPLSPKLLIVKYMIRFSFRYQICYQCLHRTTHISYFWDSLLDGFLKILSVWRL